MINLPIDLLLASSGICALICIIIVLQFAQRPAKTVTRNDTAAVQASHTSSTSRIGGLALVLALIATGLIDPKISNSYMYPLLLLSSLPVFAVGLVEDSGYLASPRNRLLAAGISGAFYITFTGEWLSRGDLPGIDLLLQWAPFAVFFTLFVAVAISHAFNLIDGLNGLAGFTGLAGSLSLATIAHQVGLIEHRNILLIIGAAISGFLTINYPFGKIFLGDAGAYVIGHLLVWMSVSILCNAPIISPFAILLIFFWPVADTLLAITRRFAMGRSIAQPDRLHFHQLVLRGVEIVILGRKKRRIANPLATLLTLPFIFTPMVVAVILASNHVEAAIACAIFGALFFATYKLGLWLAPKLRRSVRTTNRTPKVENAHN